MDLAKFLQTLGVDPATVRADSVAIQFRNGVCEFSFGAIYAIPPHLIGAAFLAASGNEMTEPTEED